jgi:hypothetical protein
MIPLRFFDRELQTDDVTEPPPSHPVIVLHATTSCQVTL